MFGLKTKKKRITYLKNENSVTKFQIRFKKIVLIFFN